MTGVSAHSNKLASDPQYGNLNGKDEHAEVCNEILPQNGRSLSRETCSDPLILHGSHRASVISERTTWKETSFLLRLQKASDLSVSYGARSEEEVQQFLELVRSGFGARADANDGQSCIHLPASLLPCLGEPAVVADVADVTNECKTPAVQKALDAIMRQVPDLAAAHVVASFLNFPEIEDADLLTKELVRSKRDKITFDNVIGHWKLTGSIHIWSVCLQGRTYFNGGILSSRYNITESDDGLERRIVRNDGWVLDLEMSTHDQLVWLKPSRVPLVWRRCDNDLDTEI